MGLLDFLTGGSTAQVAQEAQCIRNGGISIQINSEAKQIVFVVEGDEKISPMAFDLTTGLILNAGFPAPKTPDPVPA
jgi:hypothetical protein